MSVFTDFFTNLWHKLQPEINDAETVVIAFFSAAAKEVATQLGIVGLKIVTDAVTSAEKTGGSGKEKLASAQASIMANLAISGISAGTHVINAAIEGAVAQVNANKTSHNVSNPI